MQFKRRSQGDLSTEGEQDEEMKDMEDLEAGANTAGG